MVLILMVDGAYANGGWYHNYAHLHTIVKENIFRRGHILASSLHIQYKVHVHTEYLLSISYGTLNAGFTDTSGRSYFTTKYTLIA